MASLLSPNNTSNPCPGPCIKKYDENDFYLPICRIIRGLLFAGQENEYAPGTLYRKLHDVVLHVLGDSCFTRRDVFLHLAMNVKYCSEIAGTVIMRS